MVRLLDEWLAEGYHRVYGTDTLNVGIENIEGLSASQAEKLLDIGIRSLMDLWMSSPIIISNKTGIDVERIVKWQKMTDLIRIDGIGAQYAELLVRSGVDTVQKLASLEPGKVEEMINKTLFRHPNIGRKPSRDAIRSWIKNALTINLRGTPYTGEPGVSEEYKVGW